MPFKLIKGTFRPGLGRPDGDSIRFIPDDPNHISHLRQQGRPAKVNLRNGSVQLRYEGIDTMESGALQPFSSDATTSNLRLCGVTNDVQEARGHILSNQLGPHGRPIAFVFAGDTSEADGATVFVRPNDVLASVNVKQLERGHAYPLFYDTLFDDLRCRCAAVSLLAKEKGRGVWHKDVTTSGALWTGDVKTLLPIFPKLWRRIDKYVKDDTYFDPQYPFENLKPWIKQQRDERVSIPTRNIFTGFDDVVRVEGDRVSMSVEPHELVVTSS